MKYWIYNTVSGLFVGGPLEQADAIRIAARKPDQDIYQVARVNPKTQRIDLATTTVRDWTQQELDDAQAYKDRLAARTPDSLQALKATPIRNMVRAGRTQASTDTWMQGKSQALINRTIIMAISRIIKYLLHNHNDFFESDE